MSASWSGRPTTRRLSPLSPSRSCLISTWASWCSPGCTRAWLAQGDTVLNSTRDRKERIGRIVQMHANHREPREVAYAGDIIALVGLKNTTTGDTLCDPTRPDRAGVARLPRAGHPRRRRAEDQGRPGQAFARSADAVRGRPDLPGPRGRGNGPDGHRRYGRAAPRGARRPDAARVPRRRQRRQAAGRLPGDDQQERSRRWSTATCARPAAVASTAMSCSTSSPPGPGAATSSSTRSPVA